MITADHIIVGSEDEISRHGDLVALIVQDRLTQWLDCYPSEKKDHSAELAARQHFVGPRDKVKQLYSDGSVEFISSAKTLGWRHDVSTPHMPQINGVAERAGRRVLEGARTLLSMSGLSHMWWREASRFFCYLRNVHDTVRWKQTPYELRVNVPFPGHRLPFGCLVNYKPHAKRESSTVKNLILGHSLVYLRVTIVITECVGQVTTLFCTWELAKMP